MKNTLIFTLLLLLTFSNSFSQNLNFKTNYSKSDGSLGTEIYNFNFSNGWLEKTDLDNNSSDKYPSLIEDSSFDNDGYFAIFFTPAQYAKINPSDFLKKCEDDSRAYKVAFDKKGGSILYVLEMRKRFGRESQKYYITELGKKLFK